MNGTERDLQNYVHMHTSRYICIYVYTQANEQTKNQKYAHTYNHIHKYIRLYTHVHSHRHALANSFSRWHSRLCFPSHGDGSVRNGRGFGGGCDFLIRATKGLSGRVKEIRQPSSLARAACTFKCASYVQALSLRICM